MKKQYSSLAEIRAEKQKTKRQIVNGMDRLKYDVTEDFMPSNSYFYNSSNKYMNYVGYVMTGYKVFKTFRGAFKFLSKFL